MVKRIFKSKQILLKKKRDLAKNIDLWRKENYKYFKGFNVVNLIRELRDKNGGPLSTNFLLGHQSYYVIIS